MYETYYMNDPYVKTIINEIYRVAIVPIYKDDNNNFWMGFSINKYNTSIRSFGGSYENGDKDFIDTIIREWKEEIRNEYVLTRENLLRCQFIYVDKNLVILYPCERLIFFNKDWPIQNEEIFDIIWLSLHQMELILDNNNLFSLSFRDKKKIDYKIAQIVTYIVAHDLLKTLDLELEINIPGFRYNSVNFVWYKPEIFYSELNKDPYPNIYFNCSGNLAVFNIVRYNQYFIFYISNTGKKSLNNIINKTCNILNRKNNYKFYTYEHMLKINEYNREYNINFYSKLQKRNVISLSNINSDIFDDDDRKLINNYKFTIKSLSQKCFTVSKNLSDDEINFNFRCIMDQIDTMKNLEDEVFKIKLKKGIYTNNDILCLFSILAYINRLQFDEDQRYIDIHQNCVDGNIIRRHLYGLKMYKLIDINLYNYYIDNFDNIFSSLSEKNV